MNAASEWRPTNTAPKDGRTILVCNPLVWSKPKLLAWNNSILDGIWEDVSGQIISDEEINLSRIPYFWADIYYPKEKK